MLAPFYHVGLVVPELGAAQRELSSTLGLSWAKEQRRTMPIVLNGETVERDLSFVYSLEGPPHVELIGANEAPWEQKDGLHHIGVWTEDVGADMAALLAQDYTLAATGTTRAGGASGFAYLSSPTGLIVELVTTRSKPAFSRWMAGGEYA